MSKPRSSLTNSYASVTNHYLLFSTHLGFLILLETHQVGDSQWKVKTLQFHSRKGCVMDSCRQILQQASPCGLISTTGWAEHTHSNTPPLIYFPACSIAGSRGSKNKQTKEIPCMLTLTQVNFILLQVNFIYYFFNWWVSHHLGSLVLLTNTHWNKSSDISNIKSTFKTDLVLCCMQGKCQTRQII